MNRTRAAFVIARRDFTATVLSKTFFFFLLGPLFPLLLGGVFGGIGARVASQTAQPVVAVVMNPQEFASLAKARRGLADAAGEDAVVRLAYYAPEANADAQVQRLLQSNHPPIRAVLTGWFGDPKLIGDVGSDSPVERQLQLLLRSSLVPEFPAPAIDVVQTPPAAGSMARDRATTAQLGQMFLFFLTILLAGMLLSQMIEEKSNKIIEVIAAAVPIDAMFLGKLFAMLGACLLGLLVWGSIGVAVAAFFSGGHLDRIPSPAAGWPAFFTLGVVYFSMNYLLLGALFLSIGAQASTAREVQILSMPVTFAQVLIFGLAAVAVGAPDSPGAIAGAVFPLSSPLVMLARAAEDPGMWPHVIALAWQALWVGIILAIGAHLFRRRILQSGPAGGFWRRRSAA
jgi:ABC-2 type transport system permease protein